MRPRFLLFLHLFLPRSPSDEAKNNPGWCQKQDRDIAKGGGEGGLLLQTKMNKRMVGVIVADVFFHWTGKVTTALDRYINK